MSRRASSDPGCLGILVGLGLLGLLIQYWYVTFPVIGGSIGYWYYQNRKKKQHEITESEDASPNTSRARGRTHEDPIADYGNTRNKVIGINSNASHRSIVPHTFASSTHRVKAIETKSSPRRARSASELGTFVSQVPVSRRPDIVIEEIDTKVEEMANKVRHLSKMIDLLKSEGDNSPETQKSIENQIAINMYLIDSIEKLIVVKMDVILLRIINSISNLSDDELSKEVVFRAKNELTETKKAGVFTVSDFYSKHPFDLLNEKWRECHTKLTRVVSQAAISSSNRMIATISPIDDEEALKKLSKEKEINEIVQNMTDIYTEVDRFEAEKELVGFLKN